MFYFILSLTYTVLFNIYKLQLNERYMVWGINMGVCPRLEFDTIMFINCLG